MLIDEYILKINQVIKDGNQDSAEKLFREIVRVYKDEIANLDEGTSDLLSRVNMVWNLNFNNPKDMLSTNTNYIEDLNVILPKLRKYAEKTKVTVPNTQTRDNTLINNYNTINDSSFKITDSLIVKSTIGHGSVEKEKKGKGKIIVGIIGALAGIATIVGTIFAILHQLGKL